jgi:hypothetical protein
MYPGSEEQAVGAGRTPPHARGLFNTHGVALPRYTSPHQVDDGQQDDRAQKRNEQTRYAEVTLIYGRHPDERAQEPAAERRADDSDYYVEQHTLSRSHERACRPSDQPTNHEPNDDVHKYVL